MIKFIKSFFGGKKPAVEPEVPYKVETPQQPVDNVVAVAVALDLEGAEPTLAKKPRAPRKPKEPKTAEAPAVIKSAAKKRAVKKPKASE